MKILVIGVGYVPFGVVEGSRRREVRHDRAFVAGCSIVCAQERLITSRPVDARGDAAQI